MFCHDKKVGMDLMETKQWSTQKNIAQTVQLSRHRECALCLEKFKSPRILPCFHTFCLKCLTDLVKIQQRQDTFCCPTCRATTQVPPGGVDKFQVNFYLEAEIDALSLKNDLICETCTRGAAAHKCFECNQLMCESCNRSHSSFPATKCRTVLSLNDTAGSTHVIKRERYCEKHPQEVIRFFCQQCRAVICRDCKLTFHEGHPTVDLSAKAASAKELLSEVCNVFINSLQPKLEEELQEATNHKMALPKKVAEIRAVLTKKAEDIKKVVDKSLNEALAKLEQDAQEVNNEVDEAVKEMERQLTRCQSLMEHAGCLAQSGVDADVLALPSQLASFFGSGDCASSSNNSAGFSKNRCSLPFYSGQQISAAYQNPSCLIAFTNSKWCSSLQYSQVDQFPQQVFYGHQQQTETGWNELAGRVGGYIGTTQKMQLPGEDKRMKVRKHRGQRSPSVPSRYFAGQSLSNPSILADIGNVNQLLARWQ